MEELYNILLYLLHSSKTIIDREYSSDTSIKNILDQLNILKIADSNLVLLTVQYVNQRYSCYMLLYIVIYIIMYIYIQMGMDT